MPRPAALALLLPLLACSSDDEASEAAAPAEDGRELVAPAAAADVAAAKVTMRGGLRGAPQEGWVEEEPTSSMRAAQWVLPAADGDADDASLVVYFFGAAGGGGVEANVQRWVGQFEDADVARTEREQGALRITEVAVSGTYVAETFPGSGERVREEGWRMRAAVVEGPNGAHYLKLVGPEATVRRWADSWEAFVASLE